MALVAGYTTIRPEMGQTRTYEDFYKLLGAKPKMMGVVASMYPYLTTSFLTDSLMNVHYNKGNVSQFQKINSLYYEWEIDVNFIKRIEMAAAPSGDGANGSDITMYFKERYYEQNDRFIIEGSRQLCFVKYEPLRKGDNFWEYVVQLNDADYSATLDTTVAVAGALTRVVDNLQAEFNSRGYTKYQSKQYCSLAS